MLENMQYTCAREFLERAIEQSASNPNEALLEVRRFAALHDTAEFTTTQEVAIQCRLGNCAVRLVRNADNGTAKIIGGCDRP